MLHADGHSAAEENREKGLGIGGWASPHTRVSGRSALRQEPIGDSLREAGGDEQCRKRRGSAKALRQALPSVLQKLQGDPGVRWWGRDEEMWGWGRGRSSGWREGMVWGRGLL